MTAIELALFLNGSGVLALGLGVLRWGINMEWRMRRVELNAGISGG